MTLIRWQPFQEVDALRRQMDRMFDELAGNGDRETQVVWKPAIELQDGSDFLTVRAQLPGIDAKDLDIRVTSEAIAIEGERHQVYKTQEGSRFHSEFRYGKFHRTIAFPVLIHSDRAKAEFKDGILIVTLPKVEDSRHRVVKLDLTEGIASPEADATSSEAGDRPAV